MKKLIPMLLICALAFPAFSAEDTQKRALVKELFSISKINNEITKELPTLKEGLTKKLSDSVMQKTNLTLSVKDREEIDRIFNKHLSKETIYEVFYPAYENYYTEKDLKELIAFYKTPIGQKMARFETGKKGEIKTKAQAVGTKAGFAIMIEIITYLQEQYPDMAMTP